MIDHSIHKHDRNDEYTPVASITASVDLLHTGKFELTTEKDHNLLLNKDGLPGIYVFYDNNNICWYVGQTKNIYKRIREHLKGGEPSTADRGINMLFHKVEVFDVYEKDESHLALLEQMVIALRKPNYNITASGIEIKTKAWLDIEIKQAKNRRREKWPVQEQSNLTKFYFDRKEPGFRKKLPILD